jgi:16S rRNA (cytosine1402-N4)-methyltransferase
MRIDTSRGQSAAALLEKTGERGLADIFYELAEERHSRRIARAVVEARQQAPITSSARLAQIVYEALPPAARRGGVHPATKTFQALRIAVNGELERLPALLESALSALKIGGRLGVITFHSLEDRIVKRFFREKAKDCVCPPSAPICICRGQRVARLITTKAVVASPAEIERNPPSRSAKLRVVEKMWDEYENERPFHSEGKGESA